MSGSKLYAAVVLLILVVGLVGRLLLSFENQLFLYFLTVVALLVFGVSEILKRQWHVRRKIERVEAGLDPTVILKRLESLNDGVEKALKEQPRAREELQSVSTRIDRANWQAKQIRADLQVVRKQLKALERNGKTVREAVEGQTLTAEVRQLSARVTNLTAVQTRNAVHMQLKQALPEPKTR